VKVDGRMTQMMELMNQLLKSQTELANAKGKAEGILIGQAQPLADPALTTGTGMPTVEPKL